MTGLPAPARSLDPAARRFFSELLRPVAPAGIRAANGAAGTACSGAFAAMAATPAIALAGMGAERDRCAAGRHGPAHPGRPGRSWLAIAGRPAARTAAIVRSEPLRPPLPDRGRWQWHRRSWLDIPGRPAARAAAIGLPGTGRAPAAGMINQASSLGPLPHGLDHQPMGRADPAQPWMPLERSPTRAARAGAMPQPRAWLRNSA